MRMALLAAILLAPMVASAQFVLPTGEAEVNRAASLMVRGDYAAAEPLLRQAVADEPSYPYAHFTLASLLRDTGRNDEAIAEYRTARSLFEAVGPRANGEGDIANCLYGIALAEEARNDPNAAARAWHDYIRFARRFEAEQPAVAIARAHVRTNQQLARLPYYGPQTATRATTTR
jgi:tetratricopeptide (TPR) repeat protein